MNECFVVFRDGDGVLDEFDNCPDLPNGEQGDADGDGKGNLKQILLFYNSLSQLGTTERR